MTLRTGGLALAAVATLALAGCSSSDEVAKPTEAASQVQVTNKPPVSSPSAQPSTSSASPSPSSSPESSSPSPSETSAVPSPTVVSAEPSASPEKSVAADLTANAGPGTACGTDPNDSESTVYVMGGDISCGEALDVFDNFSDRPMFTPNDGPTVSSGNYDCSIPAVLSDAEGLTARCTDPKSGAYLESHASSAPILPGNVVNPADYVTSGGTDFWPSVRFSFATSADKNGQVSCTVSGESGLECWVPTDSGYTTMTMDASGPAESGEASSAQTPPAEDADAIDVGTVINTAGFSCRVQATDKLTCKNMSGDTAVISPSGVTA